MEDQRPETITADVIVYKDPAQERIAIALERIVALMERPNANVKSDTETVIAGGYLKTDKIV